MSIVAEALRKAQQKRITPEGTQPGFELKTFKEKIEQGVDRRTGTSIFPAGMVIAAALLSLSAMLLLGLIFRSPIDTAAPIPDDIMGSQMTPPVSTEAATSFQPEKMSSDLPATPSADIVILDERSIVPPRKIEAAQLPELSGIMYSRSSPQAVLDGMLVGEGESVNGFTVLSISPGNVILLSEGKEHELKLR